MTKTVFLQSQNMKLLVFQHVPHEHLGRLAICAEEQGIPVTVVEFWRPYRIPEITGFGGLIMLGGPMSVYDGSDAFPSRTDELKALRQAVGEIPILGICLGSQLLAHALGARVYPNEQDGQRVKEIGYSDVTLTPVGQRDPLFFGLPSPLNVLQWHGDAFDLPDGATRLATARACANQAFRFGPHAYGTLFHLEFTPEMVARQIVLDRQWIHDGCTLDETRLRQQARDYSASMERHCCQLFTNFLTLAAAAGEKTGAIA